MTPIDLALTGGCAFVLVGILEAAVFVAIAKLRRRW